METNKAIVCRFTEQIDNGQLDEAFKLLTPDYAWHGPIGELDREGFKEFVSAVLLAFPDFTNTIEDQISEGNRVATRTTIRGIHRAVFRGVAPTYKQVTVSEITIDRFSSRKMSERWVIFDTMG